MVCAYSVQSRTSTVLEVMSIQSSRRSSGSSIDGVVIHLDFATLLVASCSAACSRVGYVPPHLGNREK